ncbi:MAG: hypothetical protein AVDCRST_MAG62-615, partial [uncultured Sphingomonas sp.]
EVRSRAHLLRRPDWEEHHRPVQGRAGERGL